MNIVVIGASGALGNQFVHQFAADANVKSIYAFSRSRVEFESEKVVSGSLDLQDEASIKAAAEQSCENGNIDIVLVATGLLHHGQMMPEKSLKALNADSFHQLFSINTIGPALVAKHFLPKLNKNTSSVFAAISARVGSISDNQMGGWYSYRASKAALNMVLKCAAIEIKRSHQKAIVVGLHPGTVDSNLSKPFQANVQQDKLFTPQHSVAALIKVIQGLDIKDSGNVFDFNGIQIDF